MSSATKSGSSGSAQDYYGSIAGLVCCGPLDFISGVVIDDSLVWPNAPQWPAGTQAVSTRKITPQTDQLSIQTADPHGCTAGDHVSLSGLPQEEMNVAYGLVLGANDAWGLQVSIPGLAPGATTDYADGWVARVAPIAVNDLRRTGAIVYQAVQAHAATPDTAPPNPAYWHPFRLSHATTGVGNPLRLSETQAGVSGIPLLKLTVESGGELFVYWGTPDQTLDTTQENILAPLGHPPYRDQVIVVLKDFFFGRERATPPNVQIIGGRIPQQTVITGSSARLDTDGQANPFCILAEWLTHPLWGIGFTPDQLDAASWQAAADWAAARSDTLYLSPLIDRQTGMRQVLTDLLDHVDGWLRWNDQGRIEAGHWPHDQAPPSFTPANTVDENTAVEDRELAWSGDGWSGTFNLTTVTYPDAAHGFKSRPVQASSLWNRTLQGRIAGRSIERPYVTRASQALALASRDVLINAEPTVTGSLTVRAETTDVRPGDPLRVRHAALGLEWLARCTERTVSAPPAARVTLEVANERGWATRLAYPIPSPSVPGGLPRPAPVTRFAFWAVPPLLAGGTDFRLSLVAGRTSAHTTRLHLWMRQADPAAFYELTQIRRFSVAATVAQAFPPYLDGTGALVNDDDLKGLVLQVDSLSPPSDVEQVLDVPTDDAINDDTLLLILLRADGSGFPEVCTVKAITVVAAGQLSATVRRAGFGTRQGGDGASAWNPGDGAWLVHRTELLTFSHTQLPALAARGATVTFRLVPDSDWMEGDVADLYLPGDSNAGLAVETAFTLRDLYAPQVRFLGLTREGLAVDFSQTFAPTDSFTATLGLTDPMGGLTSADLAATSGGAVITWPIAGVAGTSGGIRSIAVTGLGVGDWRLVVTVQNQFGRVISAAWPNGSLDGLLQIRSTTGPTLLPPLADPSGGSFASFPVTVTLTSPTPGATMEYWLTPLGQLAAGSPVAYTGPISVPPNRTLWAWSKLPGPVYSQQASYDFGQPPRGNRYQTP